MNLLGLLLLIIWIIWISILVLVWKIKTIKKIKVLEKKSKNDTVEFEKTYNKIKETGDKIKEAYDLMMIQERVQKDHFKELVEKVYKNCSHLSSPTQIANYPAYQEILAMGKMVVPWLIDELDLCGGSMWFRALWFRALTVLTNQNPIPENHRGRVNKMVEDWKDWFLKSKSLGTLGERQMTESEKEHLHSLIDSCPLWECYKCGATTSREDVICRNCKAVFKKSAGTSTTAAEEILRRRGLKG